MKRTKYTSEFKDEADKQVIDKGHAVPDVAQSLCVTKRVLCTGAKKIKKSDVTIAFGNLKAMQAEMAKLKGELRSTTASVGGTYLQKVPGTQLSKPHVSG